MRKLLSALILTLGLAVAPAAAHADPVTYNLLLTPYSFLPPGTPGGTGTLTLASAPTGGTSTFYSTISGAEQLTDLSITIGGDTFDLANSQVPGVIPVVAVFQNGQLTNLYYLGGEDNKSGNFSLYTTSLFYNFFDGNAIAPANFAEGAISVVDPPSTSPVPEPSALLLFGTGALGLAFVGRKLTA